MTSVPLEDRLEDVRAIAVGDTAVRLVRLASHTVCMKWVALDAGQIAEHGSHVVHMTEAARVPAVVASWSRPYLRASTSNAGCLGAMARS